MRRDDIIDTVLVVVLIVMVFAVFGCGDSQSKAGGTTSEEVAGPPAEQRCVNLWNSEDNANVKGMIGSLTTTAGDVYFSVGFNENFPDKCLYTMAASTGAVSQFSEVGEGAPSGPISVNFLGEGSVNDLDEETKQWNANIAADGTLALQ